MAAYNTREAIAKLGETDAELAEYLENVAEKPPLTYLSIAELLKLSEEHPFPVPPPSKHESDFKIAMRDGHQSDARVYKPPFSSSYSPLVVLVHGGAFCLGDYTQLGVYARAISALHGATVVSISYRLAPRFKFPTAPNDLWDNLQWLSSSKNAHSLGADLSSGFIVGGVSAGANLVAVAAQKWASERLTPSMTGVWLATPYLLEEELVPVKYVDLWLSRYQNSEALILNENAIDHVKAAYEPDVRSSDFSPFNDKDAHQGLPPVYFQVCGQDPLRDDALIYEKVLQENGIITRLDMYPGVPHCHWDIFVTLKSSRQAQVDIVRGLGWLLGKQESLDEDCWKALNEAKPR